LDYARTGAYFVTICARDRECILGQVTEEHMQSSTVGVTVEICWRELPNHFGNVELDAFVIMPNHIHGILLLTDVMAGHARPLPTIIGSFKAAVSRRAGFAVWQRSYWDRIIRNEQELNLAVTILTKTRSVGRLTTKTHNPLLWPGTPGQD
jgi:putative transposase